MTTENTGQAVAVRQQREIVTHAQSLFDTGKFEQMQRAAKALMHSTVLPESIRGSTPEQCFSNLMVAFDLADRLRTTPISVTQCMSIVHGKILLEGKLVQAAIDNVLGIELFPWWDGERGTDGYRIFLSDKPWDEYTDDQLAALKPGQSFRDRKVVDGSVGEWKTYNKDGKTPKPAWIGVQTQNQLLYRATREWARRYQPTIMLGVYTDDEIDSADERRIDRAASVKAVQGLSGGFALPAAEQAKPDPEVEDAVVEEVIEATTEEPAEASTDQHVDQANAEDSGTTAGEDEGYDEIGTIDIDALCEQARQACSQGLAFAINMAWGEEAIEAIERACQEGVEAYEKAQAALTPQEAETTEATEEDELSGLEVWESTLADKTDWAGIKKALYDYSTSPIWKELSPVDIAEIRRLAWARMSELIEAGVKQDFLNDLTAFRCWIEWCTDAEGIDANWTYIQESEIYKSLAAASKRTLGGAVEGRIRDLQAEQEEQ